MGEGNGSGSHTQPTGPNTGDVAKALSHPLRMRLLNLLNDGVASPSELAKELDESLSVVAYHMRILRRLHCIELVDTRPVRGALEHFYRPLSRARLSTDEWSNLPQSVRVSLSGEVLDEVVKLASSALVSGTFDSRTDRHLSFVELELDDDAWAEVNAELDTLLEHAMALQVASAGRSDAGDRVCSGLVLAHFERPARARRKPAVRRRTVGL